MKKKMYRIAGRVWVYPGMDAWRFVNVDKKTSADIKAKYGTPHRGFGSVPVEATLGKTVWKSSIFPDKASGCYLLPLKSAVRRAEGIEDGEPVTFSLRIQNT